MKFARAVARMQGALGEHQLFGQSIGAIRLAKGLCGTIKQARFALGAEAIEPFVAAFSADAEAPAKLGKKSAGLRAGQSDKIETLFP